MKSQIHKKTLTTLFSSNRSKKHPPLPRMHRGTSATTRIDFMDLSKGTGGTAVRSFRRPPTTIGNGPQSKAIWGETRVGSRMREGRKKRRIRGYKPEFLVFLTADYQSDLHRATKINFCNGIVAEVSFLTTIPRLLDSRYRMGFDIEVESSSNFNSLRYAACNLLALSIANLSKHSFLRRFNSRFIVEYSIEDSRSSQLRSISWFKFNLTQHQDKLNLILRLDEI